MAEFKKISESDISVTYAYKTDYDDLSVSFDKEMKSVNIHYAHFIFNEPMLEPQQEQWEKESDWIRHSAHYGHWQSETIITLSADDIEFINRKCKEIFGD